MILDFHVLRDAFSFSFYAFLIQNDKEKFNIFCVPFKKIYPVLIPIEYFKVSFETFSYQIMTS